MCQRKKKMESVRTLSSTVHEFWRGVVEWRSPASGPYLMLVNIAFWSTALYCSELVQLRILLSLAAGVVGWDVLLSPTHERSIATHVALWPVQNIWRTLSVCGCLYSSHQLQMQQLETACIAAYATVGCLLVNPVWNYYEVNQKIVRGSKYCGRKAADAATVVIVRPLQAVYRGVKYVVLLQFVPPLWKAVKSCLCRIGAAVKEAVDCVVNGIRRIVFGIYSSIKEFVLGTCRAIKNLVLGVCRAIKNFVLGTCRAIKNLVLGTCRAIKNFVVGTCRAIKNFVLGTCRAIKNFVLGTCRAIKNFVLGTCRAIKNFLLDTWNRFKNLLCRMGAWISLNIITPTKNFFYAVGRWLRYWFCAHWWPDLKLWIKEKIGGPLRRAFNYFCFGLMYVFCGHWIPPLRTWLGAWLRRFKDFTMIQLRRLGGFLHRTVVVPTKNFLRQKFDEFRGWLRRCLHRLAVAIRDSVLWPICVLVVDAGRELSLLMYRVLLQPVLDYVYQRYKILETAILIYFLGPVCDTIVRNIPEKSPFCDDSDVELEGMLPDEITDEIEEMAIAGETEGDDSLGDIEPPSPLDEEERDFTAGLAFPTIHASESSDEEIDLKIRKKPATTRKKRQKEEKPAGPADVGAAPELPITEEDLAPVLPRRRRNDAQNSFDGEFELLQ
nr:Hypothetical protein CBG09774 [Haemonchus contortus]